MLFRRFAAALALLVAGLTSQLPEFVQQYRQRLGGAVDELAAIVGQFDTDASRQSLTRDQGIARLKENSDPIAQGRGQAMDDAVVREARLERQRDAFRTAGPLSQYGVLAEDLDPTLARNTLSDFQPAVPVTVAGLTAALVGFVLSWLLVHLARLPFRRAMPAPTGEQAVARGGRTVGGRSLRA